MSRSKTQPSLLRHIRETLETGEELTGRQRDALLFLVDNTLEKRKATESLQEFHRWIRLGEPILTDVEKELNDLRALVAGGENVISVPALYDMLEKYRNYKPKNDVDIAVNWILDKITEEIEKHISTFES